jgi:hypothetical protein
MAQNHAGQNPAQRPQGPDRTTEDPVVGTGMTRDQTSHRLKYVCDGSSARSKYGADSQRNHSLEGWLCKCYGKTHENWLCGR